MEAIAQRWSELAERRRAHFVELYDSGRWKHYYTEEEFVAVLRDVVKAAESWSKLATPLTVAPAYAYDPSRHRKAS